MLFFIFAFAEANTAPLKCLAELHNATECNGNKLKQLSTGGNMGACCNACNQTQGCGAFTFAPQSSGGDDCWLHSLDQCTLHPVDGRVAGKLPSSGPSMRLHARAFNLSTVRLLADSENQFAAAQALNTRFLKYLDPDRMMYPWRMVAGLKPYGVNGAVPYGGWMELGPQQRMDLGHFSGHYLSATAFTAAATGDPIILQVDGDGYGDGDTEHTFTKHKRSFS